MKKFLIKDDSIIKVEILKSIKDIDNYPYSEGWRDDELPQINNVTQYLGKGYYDKTTDKVTYEVLDKVCDIEEVKSNLFQEFDLVLNDFATIIARCKFIQEEPYPQGLLDAIAIAKQTRINTIAAINAISSVGEALSFKIRQEDVDALKELFKPYM